LFRLFEGKTFDASICRIINPPSLSPTQNGTRVEAYRRLISQLQLANSKWQNPVLCLSYKSGGTR